MEGRKRIVALFGCLCLAAPTWAQGLIPFKEPQPPARWELVSLPLVPAPLENYSSKPIEIEENATSLWNYPTEVALVAYPLRPHHNLWAAVALERYKIRWFSPDDYPYILPKTPIPLY